MKKRQSGFMGFIISIIILIIISGLIYAWAKNNNIKTVNDGIKWISNKSKQLDNKVNKCVDKDCQISLPNGNLESRTTKPRNDATKVDEPRKEQKSENQETNNNSKRNDSISVDSNSDKTNNLLNELNKIEVKNADKINYDRSEWKHWISTNRSCWNVRESILLRDSKFIELADINKNLTKDSNQACYIISGTWVDKYSGESINNPNIIDIDHIIPLAYVANHGGQNWSPKEKQIYANDPEVLIAVSAKENRSKSDKGPSKYLPKNDEFKCEYSNLFIKTAIKYKISIDKKDRDTLESTIKKYCKK